MYQPQPGDLVTVTRIDRDHTTAWTGVFGGFTETRDFTLGDHGWFSSGTELSRLHGVTQTITPAVRPQERTA